MPDYKDINDMTWKETIESVSSVTIWMDDTPMMTYDDYINEPVRVRKGELLLSMCMGEKLARVPYDVADVVLRDLGIAA